MQHYVKIEKNARYFSKGEPQAEKLLIVLHGYGQLASYFINKFSDIDGSWYIVAPEGLHRFYKEGYAGRVGASWMTKEDRQKDIEDNMEWLKQLVTHLTTENNYREIVILGFSQGASTATRFFYSGQQKIDRLIIWASVFPADIEVNELFQKNELNKKNSFVIGTKDEFFTDEQRLETISFFDKLNYKTVTFEGSHQIDTRTLNNIL